VGAAQGVGSGQDNHLLGGHVPVREPLDEAVRRQVRAGERQREGPVRDAPVAAAGGNLVEHVATGEVDAVACGEGEDVGA
jgi:hypothetical protein